MPEVAATLAGAATEDNYYSFAAQESDKACLIFYPGGLVEPEAYAPLMQQLATAGVHSFLLRPPLNLAIINIDQADAAKASTLAQQHCQFYVLAGHSLGGVVATMYAADKPGDALLLIASYFSQEGLEDYNAPTMIVTAEQDLLSTAQDIEENKINAPANVLYRQIAGGNHAQMGYYGEQNGDGIATISRQRQQEMLLGFTLELVALARASRATN